MILLVRSLEARQQAEGASGRWFEDLHAGQEMEPYTGRRPAAAM